MNPALIDTNIISYYLFKKEKYPTVEQNFDHYLEEHSFIYVGRPTIYEIRSGLKYKNALQKLADFESFMEQQEILEITNQSTEISSDIYSELRQKGITIGDNDIYLAGIALENDLELCTNNTKHFKDIPNLKLVNWV